MIKNCVVLCLLVVGCLAAEKQIKLEDIERDNLISEKQAKQQHYPQQIVQIPKTQPFIPSQQIHPQGSGRSQFLVPSQYVLAQPQYQIQYVSQQPQPQPQPQLQPQPQQRLVYVQPTSPKQSPLRFVMFLDPNDEYLKSPVIQKGLVNDPHHSQQTHNLVGLLQRTAYTNTLPNNYRAPTANPPAAPQQPPQPTPHQLYSFRPGPGAPLPVFVPQYVIPGINYAAPRHGSEGPQAQQSVASVALAPVRQPTSLLDSYVPSVLQLQYYRQLQEAQPSNYFIAFQPPPHHFTNRNNHL